MVENDFALIYSQNLLPTIIEWDSCTLHSRNPYYIAYLALRYQPSITLGGGNKKCLKLYEFVINISWQFLYNKQKIGET